MRPAKLPESYWVTNLAGSVKCNNTQFINDFIKSASDNQIIDVRADLKACIARTENLGHYWGLLSIVVAIGILASPRVKELVE